MNLKAANTIIERALDVGHKNKLNPLTVCVLDAGGNLVAFQKEDGSSLFRYDIARGKAMGALGMGMDSRDLAGIAEKRPAFMQSAFAASHGALVPVPGGVLLRNADGRVIGAVGVSGDLRYFSLIGEDTAPDPCSEADEACAIEGIKAAGLSCKALKDGAELYLKAHL